MNRRIKLRHIRAFLEIAQCGQMKAAADRLALTQPAISRTLKELEGIVGTRLFSRDKRGAALTKEGEFFHQFARSGLSTIDQGLTKLDELRRGEGATIGVGVLPSVAARLMPAVVEELRALSPDIAIVMEDGPHDVLVGRLRMAALDAVVGRLGPPETMAGVAFTQLYMEHVAVVTGAQHPLAGKSPFNALGEFPVIYPNTRAAIRPLVDRMFLARGVTNIPNRVEAVSEAFGRAMTLNNDAIWIISEGVVANDIRSGQFVEMDIDTTMTAGPVGMMTRANETLSPVQKLLALAIEKALPLD